MILYKKPIQRFCLSLGCVLFFCFSGALPAQDHAVFTRLLKKTVKRGLVQYKKLKKNPLLARYIKQLAASRPNKIKNKKKQLAFWINAYNAYTLKLIVDNYPLKSIRNLSTSSKDIWKSWKFRIHKKKYTLDEIEHKIIRPRYKEPRIHAALVCAAKSCPPLRAEAYEGSKLEKQLADQMRRFLSDTKRNYFDSKKKTIYLSKIFEWFKDDFTQGSADLKKILIPYFPPKVRKKIRKVKKNKLRLQYLKYDWALNNIK